MTSVLRSTSGPSSSGPVREAVIPQPSRSLWQMLTCRLTRYRERLPDFLCLGAQKSGTTTLHELLTRHPGVYLPPRKELQYFTLKSNQDPRWYSAHFQMANANQSCGEITPYYLFHPAAPRRIHTLLPDAKLIVLLRDPVERALSGYFHSVRHGFESLSLEEAFDCENNRLAGAAEILFNPGGRHDSHQHHSYLSRSRYELQIGLYRQFFAPSQMLLIRSEDLFQNADFVWNRVLDFLGLPRCSLPSEVPCANPGAGELAFVDPHFRQQLRRQLDATYRTLMIDHGIHW